MREQHAYKLLNETSYRMSNAIRIDGTGNFESAIEYYSAGVKKLNAVLKDVTDEETRSFYTRNRTAVIQRMDAIREQYVSV